MKLYTLEEAKLLVNFYSEKLIGKNIIPDFNSKVIRFDIIEYDNGKFRVNCVGSDVGSVRPVHEISSVAKYYDLSTPEEVLDTKN